MNLIISERQAEQVGTDRTGGQRGSDFNISWYRDRLSGITAFSVEIMATGEVISIVDPRAAVSAQHARE